MDSETIEDLDTGQALTDVLINMQINTIQHQDGRRGEWTGEEKVKLADFFTSTVEEALAKPLNLSESLPGLEMEIEPRPLAQIGFEYDNHAMEFSLRFNVDQVKKLSSIIWSRLIEEVPSNKEVQDHVLTFYWRWRGRLFGWKGPQDYMRFIQRENSEAIDISTAALLRRLLVPRLEEAFAKRQKDTKLFDELSDAIKQRLESGAKDKSGPNVLFNKPAD